MSNPQRDRYDVLQSYENRDTGFEADDDSATLGQKNIDDTSTRTKITQVELAGLGIIGNVASVAYGTWHTQSAALLSFEFKFRGGEGSLRLKSAEIAVSFQPKDDRTSSLRAKPPAVVAFFPGEKQRAPRTKALAAGPEFPNRVDLQTRPTLWGSTWSTDDGDDDEVSWNIVEEHNGAGIPNKVILCAVVAPAAEPFQAVVKGEARTALRIKLRCLPWSKDDPVLFDAVTERGFQPTSRKFEELTHTSWDEWVRQLDGRVTAQPTRYPISAAPTAVNSTTHSSALHEKSAGIAYRIRGVPSSWTEEILVNELAKLLDLQGPANEISLLSFANSPYPHRLERTAIVSFTHTPSLLSTQTSNGEWTLMLSLNSSPPHLKAAEPEQALVVDTHFEGFTALGRTYSQEEYNADIIVIPGLGGHAYGSFKERGGSFMWVQDLLPQDLVNVSGSLQTPRILTYGYNSRIQDSQSYQTLWDIGRKLELSIRTSRLPEQSTRPIIFIAHSLGGLVAKEAIISMSIGNDARSRSNLTSICGAIFFGVPNRGMDVTSLIPMAGDQPNRRLLESIGPNSQLLAEQGKRFNEVFPFRDSKIISIFETMLSPTAQKIGSKWSMSGEPAVLVDRESATHGRPWENGGNFVLPLDRSHSDLVKFTRNCHDYELILGLLKELLKDAERVIARRFEDTLAAPDPK